MASQFAITNIGTFDTVIGSQISGKPIIVTPIQVVPAPTPDYWWRADSGLTTSAWTASNGGLDFTFTSVTTASSELGVVFNGTNGFGQTPLLTSNIAATHVLLRLDSIVANTDDAIMGGTQNNIHEIAHSASGFWNIVDARAGDSAASPRYGVRTTTNLISPVPRALWFDFTNGSDVNVYTDANSSVKATMATFTGTYNNLFTWQSGYRMYLGRRQQVSGGSGYMRMRVKELAIFTSSLSYEEVDAFRTQMLARWDVPTTLTLSSTTVNYAFTQSASVPADWRTPPLTYSLAVEAVPVTQSIIITEVSGATATGLTIQSQSDWFSAQLSTTSTPTTMSIILKNTRLETGSYTSSVTISSNSSTFSNTPITVTASVLDDIEIQPNYWWRADSGLTTSAWTASNGGLDFTFTNVTTASAATGVVFDGTSGFGLTQNISSNIAAKHIFLRFDNAGANLGDSMMGGTQATNHSLNRVTSDLGGYYNITDISGSVTNYNTRTPVNLYNSRKLLWYDFTNGSDQGGEMTIYYDVLTSRTTPSRISGTFTDAFTWVSGSGIYLGRSGGATSFARMDVKEVAIFTTPLTVEQGAQFYRQMLRRWP